MVEVQRWRKRKWVMNRWLIFMHGSFSVINKKAIFLEWLYCLNDSKFSLYSLYNSLEAYWVIHCKIC